MTIKELKHYIEHVVKEISSNNIRAAGIIIFKKIDDADKILVLKSKKGYDLPKGRLEPGESSLGCAVRETLEETGIDDLDFYLGTKSVVIDQCQMYIARTEQEPMISKNPETNQFEHTGYKWVDPKLAVNILPGFLASSVDWAIKNIH